MVLYEVDSNAILVQSMQNRTSGEMVAAYNSLVNRLKIAGFEPKLHLLDNKCSQEYKEAITKNRMKLQLVPSMTTEEILLKKQSKHSRTILSLYYVVLMRIFQCNYGVASSEKPSTS